MHKEAAWSFLHNADDTALKAEEQRPMEIFRLLAIVHVEKKLNFMTVLRQLHDCVIGLQKLANCRTFSVVSVRKAWKRL